MEALGLLAEWPVGSAAAAVVQQDGTVSFSGPVDRTYGLASVTKPLSALACLVAAEEGILALDEPAGPPGSTVRHLLAHASGLAPDHRRLLTEPGTRRIYSNAGYELLGELVQRRAEMPFADYFAEAVCEPLGLQSTVLDGSPAHGARASVRDLATLLRELLRPDPQLIARETRMQFASAVFPEIPGVVPGFGSHVPNPWGLGVELRGHKTPHWTGRDNSPSTYGHFGQSGAVLWVDPGRGCGLAVLCDRDFGPWCREVWPTLADSILHEIA